MTIFRNYEVESYVYNNTNPVYCYRFDVKFDNIVHVTVEYIDCCGTTKSMNVPFTLDMTKKTITLLDSYDRGSKVIIARETEYSNCILAELGAKFMELKEECCNKDGSVECKIPSPVGFKDGDILVIKDHTTGELTFTTPSSVDTLLPSGTGHLKREVIVKGPDGLILHKLIELPRMTGHSIGDVITVTDPVAMTLGLQAIDLLPDPSHQPDKVLVGTNGMHFVFVNSPAFVIPDPTDKDEGKVLALDLHNYGYVYVTKIFPPTIPNSDMYNIVVVNNGGILQYQLLKRPTLPHIQANDNGKIVVSTSDGTYILQKPDRTNAPVPSSTINDIAIEDYDLNLNPIPKTLTINETNINVIIDYILNNSLPASNTAEITETSTGGWDKLPILSDRPINFSINVNTSTGLHNYLIIYKPQNTLVGHYILETSNVSNKRLLLFGGKTKEVVGSTALSLNDFVNNNSSNDYNSLRLLNSIALVPDDTVAVIQNPSVDVFQTRPVMMNRPINFAINVDKLNGHDSYIVIKNPSKKTLNGLQFNLKTTTLDVKNLDFFAGTLTKTSVNTYKALEDFTKTPVNTQVITSDGTIDNLIPILNTLNDNSANYLETIAGCFTRKATLTDKPIVSTTTNSGWLVIKTPMVTHLNGKSFVINTSKSNLTNKRVTCFTGKFTAGIKSSFYIYYIHEGVESRSSDAMIYNTISVATNTGPFYGSFSIPDDTYTKYAGHIEITLETIDRSTSNPYFTNVVGLTYIRTINEMGYTTIIGFLMSPTFSFTVYDYNTPGVFERDVAIHFRVFDYDISPSVINHTLYLQGDTKPLIGIDNNTILYADGTTGPLPVSRVPFELQSMFLKLNKSLEFSTIKSHIDTMTVNEIEGDATIRNNEIYCNGSINNCLVLFQPVDLDSTFNDCTITLTPPNSTDPLVVEVWIYTLNTTAPIHDTTITAFNLADVRPYTLSSNDRIDAVILKSDNGFVISKLHKTLNSVNAHDKIAVEIRGDSDYLVIGNNGGSTLTFGIEDGIVNSTTVMKTNTLFPTGGTEATIGLRNGQLIKVDGSAISNTSPGGLDVNDIDLTITGDTEFLLIGNKNSYNNRGSAVLDFKIERTDVLSARTELEKFTLRLLGSKENVLMLENDTVTFDSGRTLQGIDDNELYLSILDETDILVIGNIDSSNADDVVVPLTFTLRKNTLGVGNYIVVNNKGDGYTLDGFSLLPQVGGLPNGSLLGTVLNHGNVELGVIPNSSDHNYVLSDGIFSNLNITLNNNVLTSTAGDAYVAGKRISVVDQTVNITATDKYVYLSPQGTIHASTSLVTGELLLGKIDNGKLYLHPPIVNNIPEQLHNVGDYFTTIKLTFNSVKKRFTTTDGILSVPNKNIIHISNGPKSIYFLDSTGHRSLKLQAFPDNPEIEVNGLNSLGIGTALYEIYLDDNGELFIPYPTSTIDPVHIKVADIKTRSDGLRLGFLLVNNNTYKFVNNITDLLPHIRTSILGDNESIVIWNGSSIDASNIKLSDFKDRAKSLANLVKIQLLLTKREVTNWPTLIFNDILGNGVDIQLSHVQSSPTTSHVRLGDIFRVMHVVNEFSHIPLLQTAFAQDITPLVVNTGVYTFINDQLQNLTPDSWTSMPTINNRVQKTTFTDENTISVNNLTLNPIEIKFSQNSYERLEINAVMKTTDANYTYTTNFEHYLITAFNTAPQYPDITGHKYTFNPIGINQGKLEFYGSLTFDKNLTLQVVDWTFNGAVVTSSSVDLSTWNGTPIEIIIKNNFKRIMLVAGPVIETHSITFNQDFNTHNILEYKAHFGGTYTFDTTTPVAPYKTVDLGTLKDFVTNTFPYYTGKLGNIHSGKKLYFYLFVQNIPAGYVEGITFDTTTNKDTPTLTLESGTNRYVCQLTYKHDTGCLEYLLDHEVTQTEFDTYHVILRWRVGDVNLIDSANVQLLVREVE